MTTHYQVRRLNDDDTYAEEPVSLEWQGVADKTRFDNADDASEAFLTLVENCRATPEMINPINYRVVECDDETGMPVEKVTDADQAAAARHAGSLVGEGGDINASMAFITMLAGRNLYAYGVQELAKVIDEINSAKDVDEEPIHPMTVEVLIQATAAQAAKEFDPLDMLEGLGAKVIPWMQDRLNEKIKEDKQKTEKMVEARRVQRLAHKIEIGLSKPLDRERPLVFVGNRALLAWLRSYMVDITLDRVYPQDAYYPRKVCIAHLTTEEVKRADPESWYIEIGPRKRWEKICKNAKSYQQFRDANLYPLMKRMIDVVVVDDLAACGESVSGKKPEGVMPAPANSAVRTFQGFANNNGKPIGVGLLGFMPTDDLEPPSLAGETWSYLKTFVDVCTVRHDGSFLVVTGPGGDELLRKEVDGKVIAAAQPNRIYVP